MTLRRFLCPNLTFRRRRVAKSATEVHDPDRPTTKERRTLTRHVPGFTAWLSIGKIRRPPVALGAVITSGNEEITSRNEVITSRLPFCKCLNS